MPNAGVTRRHPDYSEMIDSWITMRDCIIGSRAIKAASTRYLPMLAWKTNASQKYEAYKRRALFVNIVKRTKKGLEGLVFRKHPEIVVKDGTVDGDLWRRMMIDITLRNLPMVNFAKIVFGEVLGLGRCGILVDSSDTEQRPFMVYFRAEDITNWVEELNEGERRMRKLVLREFVMEPSTNGDEFDQEVIEQYRVIDLVDGDPPEGAGPMGTNLGTEDGRYVVHRIFRKVRENDSSAQVVGRAPAGTRVVGQERWEEVPSKTKYPSRRGTAIPEIPFVFINSCTLTADVDEPTMIDLAEVNLSLYRTSADLENGRHYTGLPQPFAFGVDTTKELEIGSSAWLTENSDAKAGYVEFTGQGLTALERAIVEKQQ